MAISTGVEVNTDPVCYTVKVCAAAGEPWRVVFPREWGLFTMLV